MRLPKLGKPISTGAYSTYPYSETIASRLKFLSVYEDKIDLSRTVYSGDKKYIAVPRAITPLGEDKRVIGDSILFDINFKPRNSEQARVLQESVARMESGESFLVRAPTGFGKTIVASAMIGAYGRKTLIIVPKNDITDQWVKALKMVLNIDDSEIGFIQGNTCDVKNKKVCIAMVHSVCKKGRYPDYIYTDFGLVMVDETHVMGADTFQEAMWMFNSKIRVGLSATPERKDGKDIVFYSHIGGVRVSSDAMPLAFKVIRKRSGWILPKRSVRDYKSPSGYKTISLPHRPGRTQNVNKALAKDQNRNKMIAEFVNVAYRKGRSTIVFSDLKEAHLDRLHTAFVQIGIPKKDIAYYVGGMKAIDRERAKTKPVILATYAMCSMATDIPWLDTCVLATPRSDVIQIVGRILREYDGKKEPIVFDVVDDASAILVGYSNKRLNWYRSLSSRVINVS